MNRGAELSTRGFFLLLVVFYALGAVASLMRLRFGDEGLLTQDYQRVGLPALIGMAAVAIVWARVRIISPVVLLLLGLFIYGLSVGVWSNGLSRYLVSHIFQAAMAIVLLAFGRALAGANPARFYTALRRVSRWSTIIYVPVMAIFAVWALSGTVYFGMSASILVLAAIFFLNERRYAWALLAAMLILLSGKRGELLGLLTAVGAHLYLRGQVFGFGKSMKQAMVGVIVVGIGLVAALLFQGGEMLAMLESKFTSILTIDLSDLSSGNVRAAIGGRGIELFVLQQEFAQEGSWRLLFGLGYGWNVTMYIAGFSQEVLHFVHLSPLNAVAQYGLIGAALYWGALVAVPVRAIGRVAHRPEILVLAPYVFGMLVVSLTAYVIAVDPMFWLCFGALTVRAVQAAPGHAPTPTQATATQHTITAAP